MNNTEYHDILTGEKKQSRFPFWVHLTGRIALQGALGYGVYYMVSTGHWFFAVGVGVLFIWHIVSMVWGPQIYQIITEEYMKALK